MEPPIPYTGSKRLWAKELTKIAETLPKRAKVLDAFGGTGLVSHVLKSTRPDLRVTCNDSDGYLREWLPHAEAVRRFWDKYHARKEWGDSELEALARAVKSKELADKMFAEFVRQGPHSRNGQGNHRLSWPEAPENYCDGVARIAKIWGPRCPIPVASYDFIILDPPYNTVKALDSTMYGTRRDDPPLSLWAAQEAFKSTTPAICWGRDGWLVDYDKAIKLAQKRASIAHNIEWMAGNPAAVKLGLKPSLFA